MLTGTDYGTLQQALLFHGTKKRGRKSKAMAELENNQEFLKNLTSLEGLTIGRFNWDFPEDSPMYNKDYFIERSLLYSTLMVYYESHKLGKKVLLPAMGLGELNLFGSYNKFEVMGANGFREIVDADECVVLWDRIDRNNFSFVNIYQTAKRLTDAQRTCDVRMLNHKKPIVWLADQDTVGSLNNILGAIENNEKVITVRNGLVGEEGIQPMPMTNETGFLNLDILSYYNKILNKYYCDVGIDYNPEAGKKERMITDEVQSNNEQVRNNRYVYQYPREIFCEEVEKKFGDKIEVSYVLDDEMGVFEYEEIEDDSNRLRNDE